MNEKEYESLMSDIRLSQTGEKEALERIVVQNDKLVRFVVNRYRNCGKEYDDLYQLGRMGLIRAVMNFKADYGVRFSTYAVPMIAGEILRFLRDDGQMRVSRSIRENAHKAILCAEKYMEETGNEPRLEDICARTGISEEDAVLALGALSPVRSLSEPLDEEGNTLLGDTIGMNPYETIDRKILIQNLLSKLNEKDRRLIELRYFHHFTQAKAAEFLGLTQVQVSRLEKKLLIKMKEYIV